MQKKNISSSGLINLEDIKPSFDALDERNEKQDLKQKLKAKKKKITQLIPRDINRIR